MGLELKKTYSDEEIIQTLRYGSPRERRVISNYLYKTFIPIAHKASTLDPSQTEIFQSAYLKSLVAVIKVIRKGKFRGDAKISSYFFTVMSKEIIREKRKIKGKKHSSNSSNTLIEKGVEEIFIEDESLRVMNMLLSKLYKQLGKKCKELMEMDRLDFTESEISELLDFSYDYVKTKRNRCWNELRGIIISNPVLHQKLKDLLV